ncbi:P-loop NTPase fold protein [Yersinia enterocolitica]|nr:NTPase [Yersinia enterocolitica]
MNNNIFNLDWDWDKEIIFNLDGENELLPADKLDRRRYAEYLYFYLKENGSKNNTVINLNAEWGAGKTFFVKRLYSSLKDKHPCIYIDAWKQDYSDDPFLTLFSSLISQIEHYSGRIDSRLIRIGDSIGRFTKGVIPEILSGLLKNYAGIENISDIAKSAATLMLKEHQEKSNAIITLKKELVFWAKMSFDKGYDAPIFIFIDELDRCRPNYAVSLLEIVKHIFNIDKFVFVISTDTNQLQHSIKNIYGSGFGANDYLGRFFHRRFSLKEPDFNGLIDERVKNRISEKDFRSLTSQIIPRPSDIQHISKNLSSIYRAFSLNLRDSIRNTDRLFDLINNNSFNKHIDYIALIILMVFYDKSPDLVEKISGKSLNIEKFEDTILNNEKIKNFGISTLKLTLDLSYNNINIGKYYIRKANRTVVEIHNSFETEEVEIPSREYIKSFKHFIENIHSAIEIKQSTKKNIYLTIGENATNIEKLNINYGAILESNNPIRVYEIISYLNFIELAVSFD